MSDSAKKALLAIAMIVCGFMLYNDSDSAKSKQLPAKSYIQIADSGYERSEYGKYIKAEGSIKNTSVRPIQNILLRFEIINAKGEVTNSTEHYVSSSHVGAGESKLFSSTIRHNGDTDVKVRVIIKDAKYAN